MLAPVLSFQGNCAEAIELYKRAFRATDCFADYNRDAPDDAGIGKTEAELNKIMHSGMRIFGSLINMSDTDAPIVTGNRFKLNVYPDTKDDVRHAYEVLTQDGGEVVAELGPQFFSPLYCAVRDRFGVLWQVIGPND